MRRGGVAKARTVAHHHKHVKPAHHHGKAATGHAHKHHKAAKHHAKATKHKGMVARGLADGAGFASCAAEALAESLRLLQRPGLSVTGADVLDLFRRAGGDPAAGAPIVAVLEAASAGGLAGVRLTGACEQVEPYLGGGLVGCGPAGVGGDRQLDGGPVHGASLILGVDLPGPHAVLATPDGWWSWGELFCPWCEWPDAVVEEAWLVTWPASIDQGREVMSYAS